MGVSRESTLECYLLHATCTLQVVNLGLRDLRNISVLKLPLFKSGHRVVTTGYFQECSIKIQYLLVG